MKLLLLSLFLLASCLPSMNTSELNFVPKQVRALPQEQTDDAVSFEQLKTQVLAPKCLSCHAKWASEEEFQAKHVRIGDPEKSKMYDSVKMGRMPKGPKLPDGTRAVVPPLTSNELDLVYRYIAHAKTVRSFETLKTKVLDTKCLSCHKKWTSEEAFLAKHVVRGDAELSKMYDSVKMGRMPKAPKKEDGTPGTVEPLTPDEANMIRDYINGLKPL